MSLRVPKVKTLNTGFMQSGFLGEVYNQTTADYRKHKLICAPVFQKTDSAIHQINYHPVYNAMGFPDTVEPSLTATSLQRPLFFNPADKKIHSLTLRLNLSTTAIQVSPLKYTYRPSSTSCVLFFNAS